MTTAQLEPQFLLNAYAQGWFPMADEEGVIQFYGADPRAVFPFEEIEPSKRTRRLLRDPKWSVTRDQNFEGVMRACAERSETWISEEMIEAYSGLHRLGAAHSIDVWLEGELVGGLYGIAIGGAFFGESMFNKVDHAAKIAFHNLIAHLKSVGFVLLDSQFINPFTAQLGAIEISMDEYLDKLRVAIKLEVAF